MKIYILNMVCPRTKFFVIRDLEELGIKYTTFEKSVLYFKENLSLSARKSVAAVLYRYGLEMEFEKSHVYSRFTDTIYHIKETTGIRGQSLRVERRK